MNSEILLFSPPFNGHANILTEFMHRYGDQYSMNLAITGWNNIRPRLDYHIQPTYLEQTALNETDPALWTLPRAAELLPQTLALIEKAHPDLIISDFFSLEAALSAEKLNIPIWTSIPAFMGAFTNRHYLDSRLADAGNIDAIAQIRERFRIGIDRTRFQMASDGLLYPSARNLLWTYDQITPDNLHDGRDKTVFTHVGHLRAERTVKPERKNDTPVIYISFGTVVMDNIWRQQPETQAHIREYISFLSEHWKKEQVHIVFATQGKTVLDSYPDNWEVVDFVDQVAQLTVSDVFITHGGNNSFQESLVAKTPMVVIPFFGDQIAVGQRVRELGVGINLGKDADIDTKKSKAFIGSDLAKETTDAVIRILRDPAYKQTLSNLHLTSVSLHALLKSTIYLHDSKEITRQELPFPVQIPKINHGELLFGTQADRILFEERARQHESMQFWKFKPFSTIATTNDSLPQIVDIYHDSILDPASFALDQSSTMKNYTRLLSAYASFLNGETDITNMCLKGLVFFSQLYKVHFLTERFDPKKNGITAREISHVLANEKKFAGHVIFYNETETGWREIPYVSVRGHMDNDFLMKIVDHEAFDAIVSRGVFNASDSPIKHAALLGGIEEKYKKSISVVDRKPAIKMNAQLVSIEETVFEVTHRLLSLRQELDASKTMYGVIVSEGNGIVLRCGKWEDVGIVMMIDSRGKTAIAVSEGVVFPSRYVEEAFERGVDSTTVGEVIAEHSGESFAATDPHSYLSNGMITRTGLLKNAIVECFTQLEEV